MTDDFDISLRRRLDGLAAAVPVTPAGDPTGVTPGGVHPRSSSRLALGSLVPVLAVVVIGGLVAVAQIGPFASGTSAPPSEHFDVPNGPISATTRSGDFELTIRSANARYAVGQAINIEASLTYLGDPAVQIAHGMGADDGPMGFGIDEPVIGEIRLGPTTRDACLQSTLEPRQPLTTSFRKSGGFNGDDPRAAEYQAYLADPELHLTEGTWHVYAVASFSIGECSADPIEMRVAITVQVAQEEAGTPIPSEPRADQTSTAIDLRTQSEPTNGCRLQYNEGTLGRYLQTGLGIQKSQGTPGFGVVWPFGYSAHAADSVAVLVDPDGRIVAREGDVIGFSGPGPAADGFLYACDDVRVVEGSSPLPNVTEWRQITLLTADAPAELCPLALGGGEIAANSKSGVGVVGADGASLTVTWPFGWTGWERDGDVFLVGPGGHPVARTGDLVHFAGARNEGSFYACTEIGVQERSRYKQIEAAWNPIELLTATVPNTSGVCEDALVSGTLAADPVSGIGLAQAKATMPVQWPFGWTGWRDDGDLVLADVDGSIVGRLVDWRSFAGGYGDGLAEIC